MRYLRILAAFALIPVLMTGCASSGGRDVNGCVIGGTVAGIAAAFAADGGIIGSIVGAGAGAIMGSAHCQDDAMMEPMVKDSDGDGVLDDKDRCPGTPAGPSVDADGCPFDTDNDGVPNYLDQCPGTPAGPSVDANGCPFDTDGDGVPNYLDKCPDTPVGAKVDADGCSEIGEMLAIVTNVNFDFDSTQILQEAMVKLQSVISTLKLNPGITTRIIGHADSTGTEEYNRGLSLRRAAAVRSYLVDQGIDITRLSVAGKGESEPLVSNSSRGGRAVNRRVEFEVVSK